MKDPVAFQVATITRAVDRLTDPAGNGKFLVADEVGLGKTVVAQGVIARLLAAHTGGRPLRVFYVCSNLAIARQNKQTLLEVGAGRSQEVDVDRLTLIPIQGIRTGKLPPVLQVFSMTPGTSLPLWKRGSNAFGRKLERVWVEALLRGIFGDEAPSFDTARGLKGYADDLARARTELGRRPDLQQGFTRALLQECGDAASLAHLVAEAIRGTPRTAVSTLAGRCRNALAMLGIEQLTPDLVVFDEFQRFTELLKPEGGGRSGRVLSRLRGDDPAVKTRVLLLSATPYRLFARRGEHEAHREFYQVLRYLVGATSLLPDTRTRADECVRGLESRLAALGQGILAGDAIASLTQHRDAVEAELRRVMARTERSDGLTRLDWDQDATRGNASGSPVREPVGAGDLEVFRHFVDARRAERRAHGGDVAYWSSIPLPAQSMYGYKAGPRSPQPDRSLERAGGWLGQAQLTKLDPKPCAAHPRMRALRREVPADDLALPWVAPTQPWWPLAGAWARGGPRKLLLFSRFTAVPRTVAGLLSHGVEVSAARHAGLTERRDKLPRNFRLGEKGSPTAFLLFTPIEPLAQLVNPARAASRSALVRQAELAVTEMVRKLDRTLGGSRLVVKGTRATQLIRALASIAACGAAAGDSGWKALSEARFTDGVEGIGPTVLEWRAQVARAQTALKAKEPIAVSTGDIARIARLAFCAPGTVLVRSMRRHWKDATISAVSSCSWGPLRSYLGHPLFGDRLSRGDATRSTAARAARPETFATVLMDALLDGGFEASLDEALWLERTSSGTEGAGDALAAVANWLSVSQQGSAELLTSTPKKRITLRCHAAMPLHLARGGKADDATPDLAVRPDALRRAFNSPFWPHVLCTTSVGQEGLDFHLWCRRIAHWDLPSNPVDLEQREGRVQRYGSLAVREELARRAKKAGLRATQAAPRSPWQAVRDRADELGGVQAAGGLSPWWILPGAKVEVHYLPVSLSKANADRVRLLREREVYRVVLGQPDQERLVEALRTRAPGTIELLRLRLAPGFEAAAEGAADGR